MSMDSSRRALMGAATLGTALAVGGRRALSAVTGKTPLFGPAQGIALLSRNENPYGPGPMALKAMAETAKLGCYYSNNAASELQGILADRYKLPKSNVVVGCGSYEILCCIGLAWLDKGEMLSSELTWDSTLIYAEGKGAKVRRVPLAANMSIDLAALKAAITPQTGLIHICNPNNPTGIAIDGDTMRAFVRSVPKNVTVLVDEAYMDLADDPVRTSVSDLVSECPNLIVTRTFSKIYGLAGLRIGYSLSSDANATAITPYLMSFGANAEGLAAAIASLEDEQFLAFAKAKVVEGRKIIIDAATKAGLRTLPSQTNFVYVEVPDADRFSAAMAKKGIMVRGAYGEKWKTWSRVSTGRIEDVQRYAAAIPDALKA
jgi:histidinol-phosphate aminotransferase